MSAVASSLGPTPMTSPGRLELARWLHGHTRTLLSPLLISVVARVLGQLLGVALLVMGMHAITAAAMGRPIELGSLVGWLVGLSLGKALLRYLEHYTGHYVAFTSLERLRELFFTRLVPQAPAATRGEAGSELTSRAVEDIDRIEVFYAHTFPPAASAVLVPTLSLGWLAVAVNGQVAAMLTPFVAVALLTPFLAGPGAGRAARQVAAVRGDLAGRIGDDIQGVREVLAFGLQEQRLAGLRADGRRLAQTRSRVGLRQGVRGAITAVAQSLGLISVVVVGASSGLGLEAIGAALAVSIGLWGPTKSVDGFAASVDTAMAATARIRQVIDAAPQVVDPTVAGALPAVAEGASAVEFNDVGFAYPGSGRSALEQVSVAVPAGKWTCVVGVSGSGKSTMATLLMRGWDVTTGTVALNGVDIRQLRLEDLRAAVALVPQRPLLLRGTLADNLRLGAPDATDTELADAVSVVALQEWVAGLPEGMQTPVAERGLSVSGGQLQRLALARALVARPQVLVLDEGLSQLDAATAALVRARMAQSHPTLTVLEITHRADLIPDSVQAFVLDAGRLVESGTAAQLRRAGGYFAGLEARAA